MPEAAPAPAGRVENIEALGMRIWIPAGVTIYKVSAEEGPLDPSITMVFTASTAR